MTAPLIALNGIRKTYDTGGGVPVEVLRGIDLIIEAGEFVAIVGVSGSGKSTLMNILGCLDRPTDGSYRFAGEDVSKLDRDALAGLRREAFGFIFQQYNLIPAATAIANVEVPAVYAGQSAEARAARARALLTRLGLCDRLEHRPNQLSGGQQQRVSIARALMNGGQVILADEPTGALDSRSGAEVMTLLSELADEGHTVILITHDPKVAEAANRVIEIADGEIVADSGPPSTRKVVPRSTDPKAHAGLLTDAGEALQAAKKALSANPARTVLTLLGIIIGVASVVTLMGIGEGSRQTVLDQLALFGTNRLYVNPGGSDPRSPRGVLTALDAEIVRDVPNVTAAMPYLQDEVTVRYGNVDIRADATAVTTDYPRILNWPVARGVFFTKEDERSLATVAVIGKTVERNLFPDGADPLRKYILVNHVPFQVIGVLSEKGAVTGDNDDDNTIAIPFPTGSQRIFGTSYLSWISVLIDDIGKSDQTVKDITTALEAEHRVRDFSIYNRAAAIEARSAAQNTLTLMLGFTAAISLLVGGIGIMNIMLTTVSERTREIGIRMATGARTADILRQFLSEAILLSAVGGLVGLLLGHLLGIGATFFGTRVIFTLHAAVAAFACAALAGLVFGYMPARRAAHLEPVAALARE